MPNLVTGTSQRFHEHRGIIAVLVKDVNANEDAGTIILVIKALGDRTSPQK